MKDLAKIKNMLIQADIFLKMNESVICEPSFI